MTTDFGVGRRGAADFGTSTTRAWRHPNPRRRRQSLLEHVGERAPTSSAPNRIPPHPAAAWWRDDLSFQALGDYLMAFHAIERGGREEVLRHLAAASAKPGSGLYPQSLQDEIRDAYEFSGKDPLVAKALASHGVNPASGTQLIRLEKHVGTLFQELRAAGDEAGAAALMRDGLLLAERCQASGRLLDSLVAGACQSILLKQLPPSAIPVPGCPTAGEMLADIKARKEEISSMATAISENLGRIRSAEANRYFEIHRAEGELAAGRWLSEWVAAGKADARAGTDH